MRKLRARDLHINLPGITGKYNSITDVAGVEVGYSTVILGEPNDYNGAGSDFARTGVTAILPRGKQRSAVFAGRNTLNGNGEMTGCHWIDDSGFLHGPIMITNTNSVGVVRDTVTKWMLKNNFYYPWVYEGKSMEGFGYFYPSVAETWDGLLNDINGCHVTQGHALEALESSHSGDIAEGNVGGGTGMICHDFKGGTGTSSRLLPGEAGGYTVGALVQANQGSRANFQVCGVPVGRLLEGHEPEYTCLAPAPGTGSIIVILATDAPLLPMQLSKLCRRILIGIGRLGGGYENGSGDIFLGFSTANENAFTHTKTTIEILGDDRMTPFYKAAADAVEEAILNALCAAETMEGMMHNKVYELPQKEVVRILKDYGQII